MSNAMRFGKRSLAGIAAIGLGAALIPFMGVGVSQASVASLELSDPGLVVVVPASSTAQFEVDVFTYNAAGDPANIVSGQSISAAITSVPSVPHQLADNINLVVDDGASTNEFGPVVTPEIITTGNYQFRVASAGTDDTNANWNDASLIPGNYTVTVAVRTTATGAVVSSATYTVLVTTAPSPVGSFAFTNSTGTYSVNALAAPLGTALNANATKAYFRLLDASQRPIIVPTPATSFGLSRTSASTTDTLDISGGYSNADIPSPVGVYTAFRNIGTAWAAGANAYAMSYNTPTATTGTLPVFIDSAAATTTATTLALTTKPSTVNTAGDTYTVPAGTSSLTFTGLTSATSGTMAWSTSGVAAGGQVSPSAGLAAITQVSGSVGSYTVAVAVNAAASANPSGVVFTAGGRSITVNFRTPAPTLKTASPVIAQVGSAVTLSGTLADQWERPLSGPSVVNVSGVSGVVASAVPSATGAWTATIPASVAPATPAAVAYSVTGATSGTSSNTVSVTVNYTTSGDVTALSIVSNPVSVQGEVPAVATPGTGEVSLAAPTTTIVNPASPGTTPPAATANTARLTISSTPATSITVTAPEGVYLSTATTGTRAWNAGVQTLTLASPATVTVWSTKAGVSTITAKAGTKTATQQIFAFVRNDTARNVALTPTTVKMAPNAFTLLTAKVTDVFGNPVPNVALTTPAGAGPVVVTSVGGGSVSGVYASTNAAGESSIAYTSPTASGTALVQVVGLAAAAQFGTTITGAPAAVTTAVSTVTVETAAAKSIVIVGERTTVSGKPGILVDGSTRGFDVGSKMVPNVRFPGQTTFTAGSARPTTSASGEFSWQRKTGKKTTVFFTNEAGDVTSNRVVIPAN